MGRLPFRSTYRGVVWVQVVTIKPYMNQSVPPAKPAVRNDHDISSSMRALRTIYGTFSRNDRPRFGTRRAFAFDTFESQPAICSNRRRRRGSKECQYGTPGEDGELYVPLVIRRCRDLRVSQE